MKPSEIYRLPTAYAMPWQSAPEGLIEEVFNIEAYGRYEDGPDRNSCPLMVHKKLEATITPSEHWVSILTLEHEGIPFAVVSRNATEHSGDDYEAKVTDRATYEKARAHVISIVHGKTDEDLFHESDADIEWGNLHGAVIARFGDEFRLAQQGEVGFGDGDPIFDMEKLQRDFDLKIRPLKANDMEKGLRSEQGKALALEIIRDAILRGRKTMVGRWASDTEWFAGFYEADGHAYRVRARNYALSGSALYWGQHIHVGYLCHGKFYDALDRYVRTGEVELTDPALVDLQSSFELTNEETISVVKKVACGEGDFMKAAVDVLYEREVIPEQFVGLDHAFIGVARVLAEDEKMIRFGLGSMSSLDYAQDMWARCQKNLAKQKEEDEASAEHAAVHP